VAAIVLPHGTDLRPAMRVHFVHIVQLVYGCFNLNEAGVRFAGQPGEQRRVAAFLGFVLGRSPEAALRLPRAG